MSEGLTTTRAGAAPEELLAPLLRGDFLLTDARGRVSRWGTSAARLFGWGSEDVIGRSAFDALLASGGGEWRRHLEVGEGPPPAALTEASARRQDGRDLPVELLFLPVWLSESLELSRLLEVVGSERSAADTLQSMRRDHPAALDSVLAAATDTRAEPDDARLAGLVVTFRALGDTPWLDEPEPVAVPSPAPPAVGPGEEQLLRMGRLERAEEELREALQRETAEVRSTLEQENAAVRAALEEARAEASGAREEVATVREALAVAMAEGAQALEHVAMARDEAAAARAVAEQALALAEESHMDAERRRREIADAGRDAASAPGPATSDGPQTRAPREGFDDVDRPLAVIGLDGGFELLNPCFESLVGYPEQEFRRARWPSLVDADNLVEHRRLLARLAAGDVEHAHIDTVYLHGQGLLVPVVGDLQLVRDDTGAPSHTLLTANAC